jgi:glycosyltransferase involved in cell wall biosynthesis
VSRSDAAPLRVLISAYACEPNRGSEPGAGWEWATAAAERHEVCLITSRRHAEPIRAALADDRPPGLDDVRFLEDLTDVRTTGRAHLDYRRWQRAARPVFAHLHAERQFDLAHHLTWGVDWHPAAAGTIPGLPYVWGPVGGVTAVSWRAARWLGARGVLTELGREAAVRPLRRLAGDRLARDAALVLVQSEDGRRRFPGHDRVAVAPNVAVRLDEPVPATPSGGRHAVFVGRLLAWKGLRLAVAALAEAPGWTLAVYGRGPEAGPARRLAERLGVADRLELHGPRPRPDVLAALASADALLFPSLREAAGWVVAEAVTLGVPVVCVDRGGPPELARVPDGGAAVPLSRRTPQALAAALEELPEGRARDWWRVERLPEEIDRHYRRAVAAAGR